MCVREKGRYRGFRQFFLALNKYTGSGKQKTAVLVGLCGWSNIQLEKNQIKMKKRKNERESLTVRAATSFLPPSFSLRVWFFLSAVTFELFLENLKKLQGES